MPHAVALAVVVALLLLATVAGLLLRRRSGRVEPASTGRILDPGDFGLTRFGSEGSIVQFSTAFCARCPGVRREITELVRDRDTVSFVHVDVTDDPGLSKKYGLLQTPTVLLIGGDGSQRARLSGPLSRATLDSAIARFTERST